MYAIAGYFVHMRGLAGSDAPVAPSSVNAAFYNTVREASDEDRAGMTRVFPASVAELLYKAACRRRAKIAGGSVVGN